VRAEDNIVILCRPCHRNIHEGGWELQRSQDTLRVTDRRTGREVMYRAKSENFDPSLFFQLLNVIDGALTGAFAFVCYLDNDQLIEVFRASRSLGKRAWMLQAAVLHEAQRRSVYGDRSIAAIARGFEISLRQAEKYARVWQLFFADKGSDDEADTDEKNVNVDVFSLEEPSWYIVAATEAPEPRRWLAYAQDRKAEDPRYSIRDFRSEIQQAVGASAIGIEKNPAGVAERNRRVSWDCPWVKPYCVRSGTPVPGQECLCDEHG